MSNERSGNQIEELLYCRTRRGNAGEITIDHPLSREEVLSLKSEPLTAKLICPDGVIIFGNGEPYFKEPLTAESGKPTDPALTQ